MNSEKLPADVLDAALHTLCRAMVFCRNYSGVSNAPQDVIYNIMDALHEVPQILRNWGDYGNDTDKLRLYFGCFDHEKFRGRTEHLNPPDLVAIFDEALTGRQ